MLISELFADKLAKPSEKVIMLAEAIIDGSIHIIDVISFAITSKEPIKASCIEAMEHATLKKPELATWECLEFATRSLADKAPRVKWESARLIANIAHLFPNQLEEASMNLLQNTEHPGTVVRWSAATALSAILKLKTGLNADLIPAIQSLAEKEEKNSIKKIYFSALKKK